MPEIPAWSDLGTTHFLAIKLAVALAGGALLAWQTFVGRSNERAARGYDVALALVAVLAFTGWWNWGRFHSGTYFHRHDFFHYYLGAKYSPELGYAWLYDCVAAAEAEEGATPELLSRWTRDLRTNTVLAGSPAAANPELCRSRFSADRWKAFRHDVYWFRGIMAPDRWQLAQRDHGYNATPVWNAAGTLLANTGPVSLTQVVLLSLLDPVLLIVMWGTVWWAFGWRTMTVALLWWGTNYPARFTFNGGAFLRADWLALAVIGICLARRGFLVIAGAAVGWSALLRVFPAFISIGVALATARPRAWRSDTLQGALRLLAGGVTATIVLVAFSAVIDGGRPAGAVERWKGFVDNSRKHLSGTATNRLSLKTALSYDRSKRLKVMGEFWIEGPGDAWLAARQQTFQQRRLLYWAIVVAFLVPLSVAVRGQPFWVALVLGAGLIPVAADITCYYYGFLLVYGFLWDRARWAGLALVCLSIFTLAVLGVFPGDEERYAAISAGVVLFVFAVTAGFAWQARRRPETEFSMAPVIP